MEEKLTRLECTLVAKRSQGRVAFSLVASPADELA